MDISDIKDMFFDMLPLQRRSSADWILPAGLGLGLGIAAGVTIGMLVAPAEGVETRRKLREGAYRVKDKAIDLADNARQKIAGATAQAQNQLNRSFANDMGHQSR